jgi:hypothetical protein
VGSVLFSRNGYMVILPSALWMCWNFCLENPTVSSLCPVVETHNVYCCQVKQSHYRPGQALRVPWSWGSRFQDNRRMKVVRLSAIRTGRLYPPGNIPGIRGWVDPRAIGLPKDYANEKKSSDIIGNRTLDLPVFSAEPQPLRHSVALVLVSSVRI